MIKVEFLTFRTYGALCMICYLLLSTQHTAPLGLEVYFRPHTATKGSVSNDFAAGLGNLRLTDPAGHVLTLAAATLLNQHTPGNDRCALHQGKYQHPAIAFLVARLR
jgi:hypothetical protein